MKRLMTSCAFAALLLPLAAFAQNVAPKADGTGNSGMAMNCPMTAGMTGIQKDMGGAMSDMEAILRDIKDPVMKERMQKMRDHMSAMMVNMQKMGGMGMMMGGQQTDTAASDRSEPAPRPAPDLPEDHAAHHPAQ